MRCVPTSSSPFGTFTLALQSLFHNPGLNRLIGSRSIISSVHHRDLCCLNFVEKFLKGRDRTHQELGSTRQTVMLVGAAFSYLESFVALIDDVFMTMLARMFSSRFIDFEVHPAEACAGG